MSSIVYILSVLMAAFVGVAVTGQAAVLQVPQQLPDIGSAFSVAIDGDTILVADGLYSGPQNRDLDFLGKNIVVLSESGAEACIIDCEGAGRAFLLHNGETPMARVIGFTIRNGTSQSGGAIFCQHSSPIIEACQLESNTATQGGAIYCQASSVSLLNCTFYGNSAGSSGGGVFSADSQSATIRGCTFSSNSALFGGSIYFEGGTSVLLAGSTFVSNQATWDAGAVYCDNSSPEIQGCTFISNRTIQASGGGAVSCNSASPLIRESLFSENQAGYGGALYCESNSNPVIIRTVFSGNNAATGGAISCLLESSPIIGDCRFMENTAQDGGALHVEIACNPAVYDSIFIGNSASSQRASFGGAIFNSSQSSLSLVNCLLSANNAEVGVGIFCGNDSALTAFNVTFADHASGTGSMLYAVQQASIDVVNSILWNATVTEIGHDGSAKFSISYTDIQDGYPGAGNINDRPLWVSGSEGNYYLSSQLAGDPENSPCLDAGSEPAQDVCYNYYIETHCLDNRTSTRNGVPDSNLVNLGYHYPTFAVPTPTPTPLPTPTQTPYLELGVALELSQSFFGVGDHFQLAARLMNPTWQTYYHSAFFVVLDLYGNYYYYTDRWSTQFSFFSFTFYPGLETRSIFDFIWPVTGSTGGGAAIFSVILDPNLVAPIGQWDMVVFGWDS